MRWHVQRLTLVELLLVVGTVAVMIALIVQGLKFASSGSLRFPVRVLIFDAERGRPIANANVTIFHAAPLLDSKSLEELRDRFDARNRMIDDVSGVTDADGTVVINYEFRTSASHNRPAPYAHLRWEWVHVEAKGYGGVVVPVRQDSLPTATLREQKELMVTVGLKPLK